MPQKVNYFIEGNVRQYTCLTYTRKGGIVLMILNFGDEETKRIYLGHFSKRLPEQIQKAAKRKLHIINCVSSLKELTVPPGNHLESLKGKREGEWSIRINDQWRITFKPINGGADYIDVKIEDYH